MAISKGTWKTGRPGTVVTNDGEGFPENSGHGDLEYYGGYLIAESIIKPDDAKLMAAAPLLLEVCKKFDELIDGEYDDPVIQPKLLRKLKKAIKAAGQ